MTEPDDLDLAQNLPEPAQGPFRLWLRVFRDSLHALQNGAFPGQVERARSFIFDPENEFFEYVAHGLGVDPDGLRDRVRKAISKKA